MHKVTYFYRDRRKGNYSIEQLFQIISSNLSRYVQPSEFVIEGPGWGNRIKSLIKAQKKEGDINHITGDVNFLSLSLCGKKTVLTVHDLGYYENLLEKKSFFKRYAYEQLWFKLPLKKVKFITTVSQYTKDKLCFYFPINPDKVRVVHNPYHLKFNYSPKKFNNVSPVILLIGSGPHKNFLRLVKAASKIPCKLSIIGRYDEELSKHIKEHKMKYEWVQDLTLDQIIQKYQECDIVFFASIHEGFGIPIIEANATGRPVITSNTCSMPEIAGNAAHIINPLEISEIENGLLKIINDEKYRENLILNGLKNIERFHVDKIIMDYLNIYNEITK